MGVGRGMPTQSGAGTKRHMSDSEEALKRQRALQEKSKRAQKRYRERKKVLMTRQACPVRPSTTHHGLQQRMTRVAFSPCAAAYTKFHA